VALSVNINFTEVHCDILGYHRLDVGWNKVLTRTTKFIYCCMDHL